jgi:hypothetical protein
MLIEKKNGFIRFKIICSFAAFFSVTYYSVLCQAQYFTGPVAMALGGAGRAATEDGEQFIHNPAAVVQASETSSSLFYVDGYSGYNEHDNYYGATLSENAADEFLAGGYAYAHRTRSFLNAADLVEDSHQISTGRFIFKHFSLGINVNYLQSQVEQMGTFEQWNGHIGAFYNPTPELAVAFVAYNIAGRDLSVPVEIQEGNKLAFGVTYIFMPQFRARMDISQMQVQNPDHKLEYQMGIESRTSDFVIFRAGLDIDDLNEVKYWSLGVAFDGPRAKVDYFYRKNFDYGAAALHGVDIRIPFW